ncbi:MAG: hypothetical protein AAF242_11585 [Bacteroidota bacterium]
MRANLQNIIPSLLLVGMLLCFGTPSLRAQSVELEVINAEVLCSGFGSNSQAMIKINTYTPFRLPNNAGLVFDWYAVHENATKQWHTPVDMRVVPLPWEGRYNVWVVARYVHKSTLSTFDAVKSPVIQINVEQCASSTRNSNRLAPRTRRNY